MRRSRTHRWPRRRRDACGGVAAGLPPHMREDPLDQRRLLDARNDVQGRTNAAGAWMRMPPPARVTSARQRRDREQHQRLAPGLRPHRDALRHRVGCAGSFGCDRPARWRVPCPRRRTRTLHPTLVRATPRIRFGAYTWQVDITLPEVQSWMPFRGSPLTPKSVVAGPACGACASAPACCMPHIVSAGTRGPRTWGVPR